MKVRATTSVAAATAAAPAAAGATRKCPKCDVDKKLQDFACIECNLPQVTKSTLENPGQPTCSRSSGSNPHDEPTTLQPAVCGNAICSICMRPARIPYEYCWYCEDAPSDHHGRCCYEKYWTTPCSICQEPARIPYANCWYCGDAPSDHHGRCCYEKPPDEKRCYGKPLDNHQEEEAFLERMRKVRKRKS